MARVIFCLVVSYPVIPNFAQPCHPVPSHVTARHVCPVIVRVTYYIYILLASDLYTCLVNSVYVPGMQVQFEGLSLFLRLESA